MARRRLCLSGLYYGNGVVAAQLGDFVDHTLPNLSNTSAVPRYYFTKVCYMEGATKISAHKSPAHVE
eukprot:SAG11_NODE_4816_length_1756_cov_2.062764_2_plen_67_part_00